MITLRLNSFTDSEIQGLIRRLEIINPENTVRCAMSSCEKCEVKHICYSISRAIDYAKGFLAGRDSK